MKITTILYSLNQKPWRDAASLILVAPIEKNGQQKLTYLMMKRSAGSKFMPNGLVFPGGTVSAFDSSPHWISLYKKAGIQLKGLNLMAKDAHRPQIYNTNNNYDNQNANSGETLPPEIVFRITALRESFEECGILLSNKSFENPPELQDENEVLKWQSKVKKNPEEFLNLCEQMNIVPNLSVLSEWSNWLTPVTFPARFDTLFYIACVPRPLPVVLDTYEAQSAQWSTAEELLAGHVEGTHKLMPPQFYELYRMKNITSLDEMKKLGDARRTLGFETWLPQIVRTKDGGLSLLPGDDLYPQNPEESKEQTTYESTNDELLNSSKSWHRHDFFRKDGQIRVFINMKDRFGQIYPPLK